MPCGPKGSEGKPKHIIFTLKTYKKNLLLLTFCDVTAGIEASFGRKMEEQIDVEAEIFI